MAEISPANRSVKLNNRILNRINETMNGSQSQLHSLFTSAANAVSSIISSSPSSSNSHHLSSGHHNQNIVINSGSSSSSSSSQHTPNATPASVAVMGIVGSNSNNNNNNNNSSNNGIVLPSQWSYNHSITMSVKLDKKMFDKVNKLAEKLLKYCQSEHMRLINSPPYIIDILPDICQIFNTIYFVYESKLAQLNDIDYFCVLIQNCLGKFQELVDLFKTAGKRMHEETSVERQKLVKYTLTYSHILAEMKSMFPKDVYEGESFRVAKKDAAEFWKANFGERVIVSWREFELKLDRVHQISNEMEMKSLRETIQLTKSNYVSIFEFDIFTRLFQPWNNLLNNWKFLVTEHPGYSAFSTYDEVHKRLQKHINKPGSYLFRLSCTKLGQWAIGYVTHDHKILQTIPQSLIQALIDGQKQGLYVYPDGRDIKIDISSAIAILSASRIQCSREQYEMYCDVGSSFQICKICSENNKDRKLEPCGHLICSSCLENWQELHSQPSCPFCRCEIKTFEPVIISPFESGCGNSTTNSTVTSKSSSSSLMQQRRSHSVLLSVDESSSMNGGAIGGKLEASSSRRKSSSKTSNKEREESLLMSGSESSRPASSVEKSRSESMRCDSSKMIQSSLLSNIDSNHHNHHHHHHHHHQHGLHHQLQQQQQQQQRGGVDRLQTSLQTMSLNSLTTSPSPSMIVTTNGQLMDHVVSIAAESDGHHRSNDDEDGYLKPSRLASLQANSLPNSSLHLVKADETNSNSSSSASDTKNNTSMNSSSTSSSSIDTQTNTIDTSNKTSNNHKFNLDLILGHERNSTNNTNNNTNSSLIATASAIGVPRLQHHSTSRDEREVLLPPPPVPTVRSNATTNLSRTQSSTSTSTSTTTTITTKMPPIQSAPPPPLPSKSSAVLTPPSLPPPPLPQASSSSHSPVSSMSSSSSSTSPSASAAAQQQIVASDPTNQIKSSSVRLRIENEVRFEQAMGQLGCDRTRAACALYLAGNDLKLAKWILSSSTSTGF